MRILVVTVAIGLVAGAIASGVSAEYHPSVGRWLLRDPAGYGDGGNLFQYAGSRPTTGTDSSGLRVDIVEAKSEIADGHERETQPESVDATNEELRKYFDLVNDAIGVFSEIKDADYKRVQNAGGVSFAGELFVGDRSDYLNAMRRELTSTFRYVYTRKALVSAASHALNANMEEYDRTAVGVHSVTIGGKPTGEVRVGGENARINEVIEELQLLRLAGEPRYAVAICYKDGKNRERFDYDNGNYRFDTRPGACEISFMPMEVRIMKEEGPAP